MGSSAGGGIFTGGGYSFRAARAARDETCAAGMECTPVKPDVLALYDGQKYDISELQDDMLKPLAEFAFNGTAAKDIPEVYKPLEIES